MSVSTPTDRVPNLDPFQEFPRWLPPTLLRDPFDEDDFHSAIWEMAVQQDGTVHTLWVGSNQNASWASYANNKPETRTRSGFSKPRIVATSGLGQLEPHDITVSKDGKIAISYSKVDDNGYYSDIFVKRFDPQTGWGKETQVTTGFYNFNNVSFKTYYSSSLSFDKDGGLHLVYIESKSDGIGTDLKVSVKYHLNLLAEETVAEFTEPFSDGVPWRFDFARQEVPVVKTDSNNLPHVSWLHAPGLYAGPYRVRYAAKSMIGKWKNAYVSNELQGNETIGFDMAIDMDNSIHFVYSNYNQANDTWSILYRKKRGTYFRFLAEEKIPTKVSARAPKLDCDSRRKPVVVYLSKEGDNEFLSFATKVENKISGPKNWAIQNPAAMIGNGGTLISEPTEVCVSPGNEFVHVSTFKGFYTRTAEYNIGEQDEYATFPFGPNTEVNIATGNVNFTLPLFTAASGAGFSTDFSLVYNSLEGNPTNLSQGWSTNYDIRIIDHGLGKIRTEDPITLRLGDGRLVYFIFDRVGYHIAPLDFGFYSKLEVNQPEKGKYLVTSKNGIKQIFDKDGWLEKLIDRNSNVLKLSYGKNPLSSVKRTKVLLYIRDSMYPDRGQTVLTYDNRNRLVTVQDPNLAVYGLMYQLMPQTVDISFGKLEHVEFTAAQFIGKTVKWKFEYHQPLSGTVVEGDQRNLLSKIYTPRGFQGNYHYRLGYKLDGRAIYSQEPPEKSIVNDENIDAGTEQVEARQEIVYMDPVPEFDYPNKNTNNNPRKVPVVNFKTQRDDVITLECQYKRCLVDQIKRSHPSGQESVVLRYFDGYNLDSLPSNTSPYKPGTRNLICHINAEGAATRYSYHKDSEFKHVKDNLKEILRPSGDPPTGDLAESSNFLPPETFEYKKDGFNQIEKITDAKQNFKKFSYHPNGDLSRIDFPCVSLEENGCQEEPTTDDSKKQEAYLEFPEYSRGRPKEIKDQDGNVTILSYQDDKHGFATSVRRPGISEEDTITRNKMGIITEEKPAGLETTTYVINGLYLLDRIEEPEIKQLNPEKNKNPDKDNENDWDKFTSKSFFQHDEDFNLYEITNPRGYKTVLEIDKLGRTKKIIKPGNIEAYFEYDREGNYRKYRDFGTPDGKFSSKSLYWKNDTPKEERLNIANPANGASEDWSKVTLECDLNGDPKSITQHGETSTKNETTFFKRNARGLVTEITHPIETIKDHIDYDEGDNEISFIRRDSSEDYSFQYGIKREPDERNRIKSITELRSDPYLTVVNPPKDLTTKIIHSPNNFVTKITDPDGKFLEFVPNSRNLLHQVKNSDGAVVESNEYTDYDALDSKKIPSSKTNNLIEVQKVSRNVKGEIDSVTDAFENTTFLTRDQNGNITHVMDPQGVVTKNEYDDLDFLRKEIEAFGSLNLETEYKYEKTILKSIINPLKKEYKISFDEAGRLAKLEYPDSLFEEWSYYKTGNLKTHTHRDTKQTKFTFDKMGRFTKEQHPDLEQAISLKDYDGLGNPHEIESGNFKIKSDFDKIGRLTDTNWIIGNNLFKSISYRYEDSYLRKTMIDPENVETRYQYDKDQRLEGISRDGDEIATIHYYPSGLHRETILHKAGGAKITKTYNDDLGLETLKTLDSDENVLTSIDHQYNNAGLLEKAKLNHLGISKDYLYDDVYRLKQEDWAEITPDSDSTTAASPPSLPEVLPYKGIYDYDEAGNRKLKIINGKKHRYGFGDINELTTETIVVISSTQIDSVSSSSTEPGYSNQVVINDNDNPFDGTAPTKAWKSQDAPTQHELTVELKEEEDINEVKIFIPSDIGYLQKFKIQIKVNDEFVDISPTEICGAVLLPTGIEWWQTQEREITFSFLPKTVKAVKFVQAQGGGSEGNPNVAWLNKIHASYVFKYEYDDNGNRAERSNGRHTEKMGYNYDNMLSSFEKKDLNQILESAKYFYTPTGQRYRKEVLVKNGAESNQKELYMYDGEDVVADYLEDENGQILPKAYYAQGLEIDDKISKINAETNEAEYYIKDAIGSVTNRLNQSQELLGPNLTNAWGEPLTATSEDDRYGFAHKEIDYESGFMHFPKRDEDPRTNQYLSMDKILLKRISETYYYAKDNPVNYVDPFGLQIKKNTDPSNNPRHNKWLERQRRIVEKKSMEADRLLAKLKKSTKITPYSRRGAIGRMRGGSKGSAVNRFTAVILLIREVAVIVDQAVRAYKGNENDKKISELKKELEDMRNALKDQDLELISVLKINFNPTPTIGRPVEPAKTFEESNARYMEMFDNLVYWDFEVVHELDYERKANLALTTKFSALQAGKTFFPHYRKRLRNPYLGTGLGERAWEAFLTGFQKGFLHLATKSEKEYQSIMRKYSTQQLIFHYISTIPGGLGQKLFHPPLP